LRVSEYQLSGATVSEYRSITIQGVFRGVIVGQRSLIFVYIGDRCWRRISLEALAREGQEVAFREETRRERDNSMGCCT
jgi:hypothetical protein